MAVLLRAGCRRFLAARRACSTGADESDRKPALCKSVEDALRAGSSEGGEIKVQGWVSAVRKLSRKLTFVHVHDGCSPLSLQIVAHKIPVSNVRVGSAIAAVGMIKESKGPEQPVELAAKSIQVLGAMPEDFPYEDSRKTRYEPGDWRPALHLRPKARGFTSVLRIRHVVKMELIKQLQELDYTWVETPLVTCNDCEGAGETFQIAPVDGDKQFFGRPVHLSVSGQLHLEAVTGGMSRVFAVGPTLRADKNVTKQHLAEFQMLEVETAFCDDLDATIDLVERLVRASAQAARLAYEREADLIERFYGDQCQPSFSGFDEPFIRLRYDDAVDLLSKCNEKFAFPFDTDRGLMKEHERALVAWHAGRPVFVTHFPSDHKPFYMRRSTDGCAALGFDLLASTAGEIAGGSVREPDADVLRSRLNEEQSRALRWYIDLRRWGHAPSAGFGIGVDRMVQSFLGVTNLKDCVPFPRWHGSCLL